MAGKLEEVMRGSGFGLSEAAVTGLRLMVLRLACTAAGCQRLAGCFELRAWQGRKDSNPRPSVLETDALTRLSYAPMRLRNSTQALPSHR